MRGTVADKSLNRATNEHVEEMDLEEAELDWMAEVKGARGKARRILIRQEKGDIEQGVRQGEIDAVMAEENRRFAERHSGDMASEGE